MIIYMVVITAEVKEEENTIVTQCYGLEGVAQYLLDIQKRFDIVNNIEISRLGERNG